MDEWWTVDTEIVECLAGRGPMAPAEIGAKLGLPEGSVNSLLALLAQEGRVRICLVDAAPTVRRSHAF